VKIAVREFEADFTNHIHPHSAYFTRSDEGYIEDDKQARLKWTP